MAQYQPAPRFHQTAAQIGHKTFLWGGRTQDFTARGRQMLASSVETFDTFHEKWEQKGTTGLAPPGLRSGACTTVSESLYHFGGFGYHSESNALHCLNSVTLEWTQVHSHTAHDQPMRKLGCGMTTYHKEDTTYLAIFAGHGIPHRATQPGARFIQSTDFSDRSGWTNEMHLFNLTNGEWTSPTTTGARPPPCAHFSLTAINHHKAVMFGGLHCVHGGRRRVIDVYIIDFRSMVWTKLERPEGAPWPVERTRHAACCLNFGDDHPQLLVTGGLDKNLKTLNDGWLLDVDTGRWRELTLPDGTQPCFGHTLTACRMCPGRIHATKFGGSPKFEYHLGKSDDAHLKLAETTVMEFESVQSGVGSPTSEWVLVGVIGSHELGTPERVAQLEKMKQRKTDHESLLPRRTSQTVDKPKFEQLPPMEKKPSLPDIKLKMEFSPKKEPGAIKTELKWEVEEDVKPKWEVEEDVKPKWEVEEDVKPKWEVEEDVKPKQVFSVSDFEKGDLIEQLTAKNKLLLETISRLKEHIAEKDVYKAAGVIAGKRKQLEASEEGVVLKKQRLSDEASGESAVEVGREDKPGIGETDSSVKVQIKALEAEIEELKRQLSQKKSKTSYNTLLGVEVVGEEEVVVTNEAMNFHWKDYGFKLHVPENALPEGTPEYHVNIKASLSGQFELPEGYELVSAVYWVATPGKFTKPVKIEAQHCANFSTPSQLCFVRTNCTQKSLPYNFKIVDGGSFTCGSKYGVLSAPHFSGYGIAKEVTPGEHSCQYCAQVYFTVKHLQDYWYCHFVITKDLEMCLTVVKRKYKQEYDIAPPITFGGEHVALEIPDDGIHTDNGWDIVPLQKARIKKAQVDNFSSEKSWVPECVLLLKWLQKGRSPDPLEYKVKLLGTGEENDFFRIFHHPAAVRNHPDAQDTPQAEEPQVELTIDDLLEVTNYLLDFGKTDIHNLGLSLGLNYPRLTKMGGSETFRDDMVAAWLQKEDQVLKQGVPSWKTLVKGLRNRRVNQTGVAERIETDKHIAM